MTTFIKSIPKFDGTPSKVQDWKRFTRAMLQLARPARFGIMNVQTGPQETYTQIPHRNTIITPVHSVKDADGDYTDNVGVQGLAGELQDAGASPALDTAATMYHLGTGRSIAQTDSPVHATTHPIDGTATTPRAAEHERPHQVGPTKHLQL